MKNKFRNIEEDIAVLSYQEKELYLKVLNNSCEYDTLLMKLQNSKNFFINAIDLNEIDSLDLVKLYHALIYEQLEIMQNKELKKEVYINNIQFFLKKNMFDIPYYFKYLDFDKFSLSEIRGFFLEFFWNREIIIEILEIKDEFYIKYIDFNSMSDDKLEEFFLQMDPIVLDYWVNTLNVWSEQYNLELPKTKKELLSLRKVIANDKKIEYIPKEFGRLQNLIEVNFSNENMSIFDDNIINNIPKEVYNLPHLQKLNISNNQIEVLPSGIHKLCNLVYLNLAHNALNEIPIEISQLNNLEEAYFNQSKLNQLSKNLFSKSLITLPKDFMKLEKLTILDNVNDCRKENESLCDFFIRNNYILN